MTQAFFSRIDHRPYAHHGCECQRCTPTHRELVNYVLPSEDGRDAASWVVFERAPDRVLFETYNPALVVALNWDRYKAVPIYNHLTQINRDIRS